MVRQLSQGSRRFRRLRWAICPSGASGIRHCRPHGGTVDTVSEWPVRVVAHQGGWDEIVLVAGPLLLLWVLLVVANRRAKRNAADELE